MRYGHCGNATLLDLVLEDGRSYSLFTVRLSSVAVQPSAMGGRAQLLERLIILLEALQ